MTGQPPKVVLASRIYLPEPSAASFRLAAVVDGLERSGFEVTVVTAQVPQKVISTKKVRRWPVLRDKQGVVRGYLSYLSFDIPLFFRLLFRSRPGLYISEAPPTTGLVIRTIAWLKRRPYIYFAADVWHVATQGMGTAPLITALVRWAETSVWKSARAIYTVTEGISNQIMDAGIDPVKVYLIGSGVDTERFSIEGERINFAQPTFVYTGTMSEFQGAQVFIEALAKIPTHQARIVMLGQGTALENLKDLAEQLVPGRVDFLGLVSPEKAAAHMRSCVAGLVSLDPKIGYGFVIPTKSLVVLSAGRPVLYAGPGPFRELIEQNNLGWQVDWDSDQVAEAMQLAINQVTDAAEGSRLSRFVINNYSLHAVADRAAQVARKILV